MNAKIKELEAKYNARSLRESVFLIAGAIFAIIYFFGITFCIVTC